MWVCVLECPLPYLEGGFNWFVPVMKCVSHGYVSLAAYMYWSVRVCVKGPRQVPKFTLEVVCSISMCVRMCVLGRLCVP